MTMVKKKDVTEERIEAVEDALSKSEMFIERNQKILTIALGGIILIFVLYFGYMKYVQNPKEKEAQAAMFNAEYYFDQDSVNIALNGDGEDLGFLDVIDDYGSTKSGNLAKYYAGVCYLKMGEYENAIDYLKSFKGSDMLVSSMALGAIGDSYVQLGDIGKGIEYYLKAAKNNNNEFTSPPFLMKAAWGYETQNDWSAALKTYDKIKKEYPKSREARELDKFIARAKAELGEL